MLALIWTVSLILAALSLLVMAALVLRRLVQEQRAARNLTGRAELFGALIQFGDDRNDASLRRTVAATPPQIVATRGFEILDLLRGDEHAAIVGVFAEAGLPAYVRRRLRRGDDAERLHSAELLATFADEATEASLLHALNRDRSPEVRIAAAISLAKRGRVPPLATVLHRIGSRGRRSRRLVDLFRCMPADRRDELRAYAADPEGLAFVRAAAVEALSRTGDFADGALFAELVSDASSEVVAPAIRALGRLGHPGALGRILKAMSSHSWEIRAEAAEASGRLAVRGAVDPLVSLLEDESWAVRYAAAKALRSLGPEGEATLRGVSEREASRSQRTASLVLAEGLAA